MARFRQYKNGIVGHRYKGLYIIRQKEEGKTSYTVINGEKETVIPEQADYQSCEWEIDKYTATDEERKLMAELYGEALYVINQYFFALLQREELTENEKKLYELVEKIRARKAKGLPF